MSSSSRIRALAGSVLAVALVVAAMGPAPASARPPGAASATQPSMAASRSPAVFTDSAKAAMAGKAAVASKPAAKAANKPAAPARPTAGKRGGTALVTWKKPAANGSTITGYVVTPYRNGKATKPATFDASTTSRPVKISTSGKWTFTVAATNSVGTGPASKPSALPRVLALPSAPTIVAVNGGSITAVLSWTRPASDGGATITGYVITPYIAEVPQPAQVVPPVITATATGLVSSVTYTFTVAARTALGTGPESAPSLPVTLDVSPNIDFVGGEGTVNASYLGNLVVSQGVPPYTWSIAPSPISGDLPPGLSLQANTGAITGVPTTDGLYPVIFRVRDATGLEGTRLIVLEINARPQLIAPTPPLAEVGAPYTDRLNVLGGTAPFAWSVASGALPPGLTLGPANGLIEGAPTQAGTYGVDVQVIDAFGATDVQQIRLVVQERSVVTLAASQTTAVFAHEVTFTVNIGPGEAQGTVDLSDKAGGATTLLGTFPITFSRATFTVRMPQFGVNTFQVQYNSTNTNAVAFSNTVNVQVNGETGQLLISEFRQSGIGGPLDQYVSLYNAAPIPMPVTGIRIEAPDGTVVTVPATRLAMEPGAAFLITAPRYALGSVAEPDVMVPYLGEAGGLRVKFPDAATPEAGTLADAAGSADGFHRGTALQAFTSQPYVRATWARLRHAGKPLDTGNNLSDFRLVATVLGPINGVPSALGSPFPRNSSGARVRNDVIQATLLDPGVRANVAPNREYIPATPTSSRKMVLRRVITNRATTPATQIILRISTISQKNGPLPPAGSTTPPPYADLRAANPATPTSTITLSDGRIVTVNNLPMDFPAEDPPGGGLFTRFSLPLPIGGLPTGESINIALTLSIETPGPFWIGWDLLALGVSSSSPATLAQSSEAKAKAAANLDTGSIPKAKAKAKPGKAKATARR
ncbi:putative Ig domain-containing protein [Micromonospora sp. NPDC049230]|uniref:putative Ig domain-containing protein n=1 Tax=Micromonospora sp. NPDC049230 TaxID=3155502 RepID=UPI0033DDCA30